MSPEQKRAQATTTQAEEGLSLLDQVVTATKPQDNREAERAKNYFKQFIDQVVKPGQLVSNDVETNIKYWVGEIDKKLPDDVPAFVRTPEAAADITVMGRELDRSKGAGKAR